MNASIDPIDFAVLAGSDLNERTKVQTTIAKQVYFVLKRAHSALTAREIANLVGEPGSGDTRIVCRRPLTYATVPGITQALRRLNKAGAVIIVGGKEIEFIDGDGCRRTSYVNRYALP